ncbi:hypothetical protein N7535_008084 [Penicillium sp. DV-2018c]|nr:hypothetical protein N7461_004121 [Penicillium sp. DV-2018c]KAJ5566446.1 hypothetical protein N7535_008084 [Penicillium sp. DV-2018c]
MPTVPVSRRTLPHFSSPPFGALGTLFHSRIPIAGGRTIRCSGGGLGRGSICCNPIRSSSGG